MIEIPQRKVLILSASAGAGHVRAAEALLQACVSHPAIGEVQHWDMLKYTTKLFRHLYSQVYLDLINHAPNMLGWIYDTMDTPWRNEKMRLAFEKFNAQPFLKAVTRFEPDIIFCTHFTPAALVGWLYAANKLTVKPAIAVTDFDCHAMWLTHSYLHYFVALEETRVHMSRLGIATDCITVSGIPIDPAFAVPLDKATARIKLNLQPDIFTILVSAGGYGVGPVGDLIDELLRIERRIQIVVIAGRSTELKTQLDELAASRPDGGVRLVPVGFTTEMALYMAAADLLIGKPGGLTTSEALARSLPMCIVNPIPGQEERNSDHLLEQGAAVRCNNLPALAWKLTNLLDHPEKLDAMREAARRIAHPSSAADIVDRVLALPPPQRDTTTEATFLRRWKSARAVARAQRSDRKTLKKARRR
jgi:processive 1,2-diacylglycerol beta-glucosyltransferase